MSRYEQLLRNYGALQGLEPIDLLLATQEVIIKGVTISLILDGDDHLGDVVFCTLLGRPAPGAPPLVLMLEANALWVGTGGCTLGLQHGTGTALLAGRAPLPLCHASGFAHQLDAFADIALRWKTLICCATPPELRAPPGPSPDAATTPNFA